MLRLLLEEHLSSREVGNRLGLTPSEVMAIKNAEPSARKSHRGKKKRLPTHTSEKEGSLQIEELRRRVRWVLAERFEDFPPAVLLRLWQLIEDPNLLEPKDKGPKDPFEIPESVREKVFELLDGV